MSDLDDARQAVKKLSEDVARIQAFYDVVDNAHGIATPKTGYMNGEKPTPQEKRSAIINLRPALSDLQQLAVDVGDEAARLHDMLRTLGEAEQPTYSMRGGLLACVQDLDAALADTRKQIEILRTRSDIESPNPESKIISAFDEVMAVLDELGVVYDYEKDYGRPAPAGTVLAEWRRIEKELMPLTKLARDLAASDRPAPVHVEALLDGLMSVLEYFKNFCKTD